jgi:hypothetical protein
MGSLLRINYNDHNCVLDTPKIFFKECRAKTRIQKQCALNELQLIVDDVVNRIFDLNIKIDDPPNQYEKLLNYELAIRMTCMVKKQRQLNNK